MTRIGILCIGLALVAGCGNSTQSGANKDLGGGGPSGDLASGPATAVCGDNLCNGGETCLSCPADCGGACPACNYSPTCEDASGAPASPAPRVDLCIGNAGAPGTPATPGSGPVNCDTPQLSMWVKQIHVNQGSGAIYCIITATDSVASVVALTNKTSSLSGGKDYYFDTSVGLFWGQNNTLQKAKNDITVNYKCFEVVKDVWGAALAAAGGAATMQAGVAGQYGWAFGLAGAAAQVAAQAIMATAGDKLGLDAQQVIKKDSLLDLTNGRFWTVQQSQNGVDWTLTVEAWGCALGLPQQ